MVRFLGRALLYSVGGLIGLFLVLVVIDVALPEGLNGDKTVRHAAATATARVPTVTSAPATPALVCKMRQEDYCLVSTDSEADGQIRYITGMLTNVAQRKYDCVNIEFEYTDDNAKHIALGLATVRHLGVGETAPLKAFLSPGATHYQVIAISGFPCSVSP